MITTTYLHDLGMDTKTSEEYITTLEKKLTQLRGPKDATASDLVHSINGMRSFVLHDALINAENPYSPNIPSEETDPLVHFDLLDTLYNMILEEP